MFSISLSVKKSFNIGKRYGHMVLSKVLEYRKMEILGKLDNCQSTENHPHHVVLGPCLPFKYLVIFCFQYCRDVVVKPL